MFCNFIEKADKKGSLKLFFKDRYFLVGDRRNIIFSLFWVAKKD